jgi:ABC-type antimicrobial peptide transport system permease subunit
MLSLSGELLREAWRSIAAHRVRSVLTALGVIIGVAAVISVLALGRAAEVEVGQSIGRLGTNLLFVRPATGVPGERVLTMRDAEAIKRAITTTRLVAGQVSGRARILAGRTRADGLLRGASPDYLRLANLELTPANAADAGFFQRRDQVILGRTLAETLFREEGAVGRHVRVNGVPMTVVGVASVASGGVVGDPNDFALVPLATARQRFGLGSRLSPDAVEILLISVAEGASLEAVGQEIGTLLHKRSGRREGEPDAYTITSTEDLTRATGAVIGVVQGVLTMIAAVSLLVGGIGIANMMLVSVTERTAEIGLRKALGARNRDIHAQFLLEGALLCALGGTVGVLLSWILVSIAQAALNLQSGMTFAHAALGIMLATVAGLAATWLPARRAALLSPADALRQD